MTAPQINSVSADGLPVCSNGGRCALCPRRCGALRSLAGVGFCGADALPRVAKAALHFGEEPPISGSSGSGAVFFCGCPLKCVYCQNAPISQTSPLGYGRTHTPASLALLFRSLVDQGAANINLVGATPYLPSVIEAFEIYRPPVSIVYNTSGYETPETIDSLADIVDIWLPDYKYADGEGARTLSGAPDYPSVAMSAILRMRGISGEARYNSHGMMTRGTIIRHLILPGRIRESMLALAELADKLPSGTPLSLMGQFTPCHRSAEFGMERPLSRKVWLMVKARRDALGLNDGWNQPPIASGTGMIPVWDK